MKTECSRCGRIKKNGGSKKERIAMPITKDNFYEQIDKLVCSNCGSPSPEYYFDNDSTPLCESCTFVILRDECNELREINDLEDENEDDVEVANKLWEEQEHYHNDTQNKGAVERRKLRLSNLMHFKKEAENDTPNG